MSFDPSNCPLKIRNFKGSPIPKVGVHLKVCQFIPSHIFALSKVWMWLPGCTFGPHLSMPLLSLQAQS